MSRSHSRLRSKTRIRVRHSVKIRKAAVLSLLATLTFSIVYFYGNLGTSTKAFAAPPTNDNIANAFLIPSITNWTSSNAAFTTLSATADGTIGSCWANGPNYNVWFKFVATTNSINVLLQSGGVYGSLRYPFIAIWDSANVNIACAKYNSVSGSLNVGSINLIPGAVYYISVDNFTSTSYIGTFTLSTVDQPSYDFKEGAEFIPSTSNWSSPNAFYTTMDATPDQAKGICWANGPNFNRWFRFTASTKYLNVQVKSGGVYGTLQYPFIALWDATLNQIACASYATSTGTIELNSANLLPGTEYYITVDNFNIAGYRGTFTISVDNQPTYDFKDGAILIPSLANWSSADAAYTTLFATPDNTKGSCWPNGPNFNRWFKFVATTNSISLQVKSGSTLGTLQYPFIALWDSSLNQLDCASYTNAQGTLELGSVSLQPGSTYYFTVDNFSSNSYRGTFSLFANDQPTYNFKEGAILLPSVSNWTSAQAAYSTLQATPDRIKGSCWNNGPNYNRWFKFQATTNFLTVQVRSGGINGSLQYPFVAVWDFLNNQIGCQNYSTATGTLELSLNNLTPGEWYYITVDNFNSPSYRGTFTLFVDNIPSYDFKEGAVIIPSISNWSSGNAAYSTVNATPDQLKGTCWPNGPNKNVWFKFQATTDFVNVQIKSGGVLGTLQYPFVSISTDTGTQLACSKYNSATGTLELGYIGLTPGNWFYINVDNFTGYKGSFTLNVDDQYTYDFYEGAIELTQFNNWTSPLATYSTVNATPDRAKGLCWNNGPNNNRWFKFKATSPNLQVDVLTGSTNGTMQYPYIAIWNAALAQLTCSKYTTATGTLGSLIAGLVIGNWYYISVDAFTGYQGTFTLRLNGYNPLPIELTSFKAKAENDAVRIEWQTASELNNDFFTIERSYDGQTFEIVDRVAGAGTTSQSSNYSFTDKNPLPGTSYYRLRQTDYDGTYKVFDPSTVKFSGKQDSLSIRSYGPNPFSEELNLEVFSPKEDELTLEIFSSSGKIVHSTLLHAIQGANPYRINRLEELTPGIYFLIVKNKVEQTTQIRILKQ